MIFVKFCDQRSCAHAWRTSLVLEWLEVRVIYTERAMDELLTLPRMARRLGVTVGWLRAEAEAGRVPHLRAGKRFLFNPAAVQQVLAARAADAKDNPPPRHGK